MTQYGNLPSVEALQSALHDVQSPLTVYGIHGMITGMFCGGLSFSDNAWFEPLMDMISPEQMFSTQGSEALSRMAKQVASQFEERISVALLLPDLDPALGNKLAALAQWCDGWLTGFGRVFSDKNALTSEVLQTINEIKEIAHVDEQAEGDTDELEQAYQDIVDHVMQSVEYVFDAYGASGGAGQTFN